MFWLENVGDVVSGTESSAVESYVDTFSKSGIENLPIDATFGDKLAYALKYAAIGIVTVFMVLIIIMAVLYIFKLVSTLSAKKKAPAAAAAPAAPAASASSGAASSGDSEEEIVAIATAAIAAARGESDCAFNVISINKIK